MPDTLKMRHGSTDDDDGQLRNTPSCESWSTLLLFFDIHIIGEIIIVFV